jgi:prephenate dehydratase
MSNSSSITIGIQGGKGSFNEQAALTYVKSEAIENYEIAYLYTTAKVLQQLQEKNIDFGIFAVSNTLGGIVTESAEAMTQFTFTTIEEIELVIHHYLMKRKDVTKEELTTVMGHTQVFLQCKKSLAEKYPELIQKVGEGDMIDTATAAKAVAEGTLPKTTAILGPKTIATEYNFDIIDEQMEDTDNNITTFLVVSL